MRVKQTVNFKKNGHCMGLNIEGTNVTHQLFTIFDSLKIQLYHD